MISFLSKWIEQIAISVIIVSIFELILPNGNLKKYIKVVLGVYIIFCVISPFVNSYILYDIGNIDFEKYTGNVTNTTNVNQESMDLRIQNLYIEEMKKDISKKVKENGYIVSKCEIDAELNSSSKNSGIHNINLVLNKENIEKVEIDSSKKEDEMISRDVETIKNNLSKYYEIDKDLIKIKIK